jgi:lipopolysaccharide biosynthesis glycosyltransferase
MKYPQNNPIIVTAANENYSFPLTVMLKSLEVNLDKGCQAYIFILYTTFSEKLKNEITTELSSDLLHLSWLQVKHDKLQGLKIDGHITIDTYFRLLIEETFPEFDKVIYMDADLIVNCCICNLWKHNFKGKHLLAVPHASKKSGIVSGERGIPSYKILGIPENTRTFNAGVLILNLKLWRRDNISNLVIEYLRKYHDYVLWWDQDGLNAILYKKWIPLSPIWNVMPNHLSTFSSWEDSLLSKEEYEKVWRKPAIVHFAGPNKPWMFDYEGPFKNIFYAYSSLLTSKHLISYGLNSINQLV